MSRPRLQLIPHLTHTEIAQRYESCSDGKVRTYWLTIYLLSQTDPCLSVEEVAETVHFSTDWVRKLVHRYNRLGPDGIISNVQQYRKLRSRHLKQERLPRQVDAYSAPIDPKVP